MKLRLPSLLLSAVVAAQLCTTATANTVIASGVSYDVGKANHYYSGITSPLTEDYLHCWATSASNVIQNWQDKYSGNATTETLPNGVVASPTGSAEGTANLAVYRTILDNSYGKLPAGKVDPDGKGSGGGTASEAFEWWFNNNAASGTAPVLKNARDEAYYAGVFTGSASSSVGVTDGRDIVSAFNASNGGPLALKIQQNGTMTPFVDELGSHIFGGDSRNHSITCWGYETDSKGNVTALFLSDSDDKSYGLFKVQASYQEDVFDSVHDFNDENWSTKFGSTTSGLYLETDDKHDGYNDSFKVYVQTAEYINTPSTLALNPGESLSPEAAPDDSGKVTKNTTLTQDTSISSKGVSVGSAKTGKLVMLTSANEKTLNLTGNDAQTSGLSVEHGSLASLENVSISGYKGSGMELEGRGYLHDGETSITGNHATNGGAVKTSTYLEIEGNDSVTMSGNTATNKGGAIYNTGTVSIFDNTKVTFSGNSASANGGNDIYNAKGGIVNIYNNEKVEFSSSEGGAAVRNEGELYIAAKKDKDVTFTDSSLDSRSGKTYVGTDLGGNASDSQGGVKFTNADGSKTLQVTAASAPVTPDTVVKTDGIFTGFEQRTPATLENVTVDVNEIAGVSAKTSSVTGANIVSDGDLLMKNLTLDASDTIATTSGAINMTNTVIKLKDFASTTTTENGVKTYSFNLEGLVTSGTLTLNNVVFDTTGMDSLNIGEHDTVLVTFSPAVELTDAQLSQGAGTNLRGELKEGTSNTVIFNGGNLAPEPATATLSLLALAALAARRKRH